MAKPENHHFRAEFTEKTHPKDTFLFAPGHEEDIIFIVKSGRIQIYLAVDGKEFSLIILGPGDIYSSHTRAHVKSLDKVVLLVIPTERIYSCMTNYPAFTPSIINILGKLLKQSFSIIENLVFKDACQRLTHFLLQEACHNGTTSEEGITIKPDLTTSQLAAIIGSSRQTVSKILNAMFQAGVLSRGKNGDYLIPDPILLQKYSLK
ncbi:MAG: Crp/Fnr family transcriptional regulator [Desulfobulbaceae bacterium]